MDRVKVTTEWATILNVVWSIAEACVTLSPGRDEHRPCRVKGSSCVKVQVDIKGFQCNNLDGVAARIQGFRDRVPTQK